MKRGQSIRWMWLSRLAGVLWFVGVISPVISILISPTISSEFLFTFPIMFTMLSVGGFVAWQRPANKVGWILLTGAFLASLTGILDAYAGKSLNTMGSTLHGGITAVWVSSWIGNLGLSLIFYFFFLLFPDGHLISRRWRFVAFLGVLMLSLSMIYFMFKPGLIGDPVIQNPYGCNFLEAFIPFFEFLIDASLFFFPVMGAGSLFLRYRRADIRERQQIKWVAFGAGLIGALFMLVLFGIALGYENESLYNGMFALMLTTFPVTVGAAILGYRLYDIDLIIRRTLLYSALTAVLGLVFVGLIVLLQSIFRHFTGEESEAAIVASTLIIAALFNPLRSRIQESLDRRFYRRKYDIETIMTDFSVGLRSQVDLDHIQNNLLSVIQETLQPKKVDLWLLKNKQSRS